MGAIMEARFFARYNVEMSSWEVFDTVTQTAVESFACGQDEELRHYAEQRALAHAMRQNQKNCEATTDQTTGDAEGR
jgi:hypothetical protein